MGNAFDLLPSHIAWAARVGGDLQAEWLGLYR